MSWSRAKSEARIRGFMSTVPLAEVQVTDFAADYARREGARAEDLAKGLRSSPVVIVSPNRATVVHGVHVYADLMDYEAVLVDATRDTEQRHKRALQFLQTHYTGSDGVILAYDAQRVDFHGGRLHAVIVTPVGAANEARRVERAVDFAKAIMRMVEVTGAKVHGGEFKTRVRVGIDTGTAVAVNSGRSDEQEPLFLGNPANYAAKLATGTEEGIYLSDRARALLGLRQLGTLPLQKAAPLRDPELAMGDAALAERVRRTLSDQRIELLAETVRKTVEPALQYSDFSFHRHEPPLATIDYAKLSPSRSIHMEMTSIFADLDGFTKYVQRCVDEGRIQEMVANLHVIRKELGAVLRHDFGGRKVRYIGDALHGILAEGSRHETDESKTVATSVMCAGALRSSFQLCQLMLPGIADLGLAIGIELGATPVSRIGIRGDLAVRCATSRAVSQSEMLQSACDGNETSLGERALQSAPLAVRRSFSRAGKLPGLDYAAAAALFVAAPAVVLPTGAAAAFRPYGSMR